MDDGMVYLASTPESPDVASVIFGAGAATLPEISELLDHPDGDVVAILAARSENAASLLARLLHEHNLTGLFELLVPGTGSYQFEDDAVHAVGPRFAEPASELMTQAERRLDIWREIAARIPSTAVAFCLSRNLPEHGEERLITADEWRYLSLLDSHRSVADVITETGESAFRVCSILYRLLLEGLIQEV